jgi:hypothetical protein
MLAIQSGLPQGKHFKMGKEKASPWTLVGIVRGKVTEERARVGTHPAGRNSNLLWLFCGATQAKNQRGTARMEIASRPRDYRA